MKLWHDSHFLGYHKLFEILPFILNNHLNINRLIKNIEKKQNLNLNLNEISKNVNSLNLFNQSHDFITSERAQKRE